MKTYNNEKAIISLTSWKKRIDTAYKTIYTLLKYCPGFHIVLVLSSNEFPKKDAEMPKNIKLLIDNDLIEILWIKKNYKALKKVLFTMQKYPNVPIISADDDMLYTCNYAQELYSVYLDNKDKICTINAPEPIYTAGPSTLYPPGCFGDMNIVIDDLSKNKHLDVYMCADDGYMELLRKKFNSKIAYAKPHKIWELHTDNDPLHNIYGNTAFLTNLRKVQSEDSGCVMTYLTAN